MKFEIENFHVFTGEGKGKAAFSVKTDGGMVYDCKLVAGGSTGYFVVANQSRSYKKDGEPVYIRSFRALKDSPAAKFFDQVAKEAAKMYEEHEDLGRPFTQEGGGPSADDDIPF